MSYGKPSMLPGKEINVENSERIISATAGGLLLAIASKQGGLLKTLAGGYLLFRGITGFCYGYKSLEEKGVVVKPRNVNIRTSVTVMKPRNEVYEFWRKLENLPRFMTHLENVDAIDDINSIWKAKVPGGLGTVKWKSEIVEDETNERIGWRSLPGSTVENAGNVRFEDAGTSSTIVHATISYHAPAGKAGEQLAKLLTPVFEYIVKQDIKNFKNYMEKGELPENGEQPKNDK